MSVEKAKKAPQDAHLLSTEQPPAVPSGLLLPPLCTYPTVPTVPTDPAPTPPGPSPPLFPTPDPVLAPNPAASTCTDLNDEPRPPRPVAIDDNPAIHLPGWRRWVALFTVCWMTLPMNFATSSILAAAPEVAAEFSIPATTISVANAGVFLAMAASPLIWVPVARLLGRRLAYLSAACVLGLCSIGSALAPNMATFTAIWVIGGTIGVVFLVYGQTILSDLFEPTIRGTAVGFFLGTCVSGNGIAPLTGGIISAYTSWRVIFGVQAGMTLIGLILGWFFVPHDIVAEKDQEQSEETAKRLLRVFSPLPVFRVMRHPNILLANISCGLLAFNQYGMLSSIRPAINERFNLTTPLTSGLFYLAPGVGFVLGGTIGGRISDHTVKRYIKRRNGLRLPRDRLRSGFASMFVILPLGTLVLGWSLEQRLGGMVLPAASAFVAGVGLMSSFSGLNTFSAEVFPQSKTEVISSKYFVQYMFSASTIASRMSTIQTMRTGWAFTLTAAVGLLAGVIVVFITRYEPKTEKLLRENR
ncbi:MFS general substrate transporter [Sodiomyces alkalinus F11]|uniref:MFS general substrate transporter n=1 Tax=Sodiomyces alkalinus (strain CBS 110278 / VKM F-3762 / F11) TaxID=1314773 RepID=A0A3N2Q207_SODAK|nr:MFS general substrate transporter [Sodiomyces alkalinus F11]ROT40801.1 MFS general substrate transporter [Sodiomyces alkalinus F11]